MTASKASLINGKKNSRKAAAAADENDPLRVVTFRLRQMHKDKIMSYALELAQQQSPPRQVSNNEAMQHMIMHATVPKRQPRKGESQSNGAG